MNLRDISLERSYISYGESNIVNSVISPALKVSNVYKRSVGFFSSSVFSQISNSLIDFVRNGGHIYLICGMQLSQDDKEAIESGYKHREQIIEERFSEMFTQELNNLTDSNVRLLEELIAKGFMDIKLAMTKSGSGIYHDKLGIFEDAEGNRVVFYGSPNSTGPAYTDNYEKIRVAVNWKDGYKDIVEDECYEFDSLWNETNPYVDVHEFTKKAADVILARKDGKKGTTQKKQGIVLRDYQKQAIQAWVDNKFHGFYEMATGTGKTWTAIYSAKILLKVCKAMVVICAPYKHLVKQWKEDVEKVFPDAKIILVSSENPGWDTQIVNEIIANKYNRENQIIIISTIKSFSSERFERAISKSKQDKLLIIDEAHRFKKFELNKPEVKYKYMLGLSATPGNGKNQEFVEQLLEFFGGKVFELPIEKALEMKYLVPYNYYPIFVHADYEEEKKFDEISGKMAACFRNGVCIDPDSLVKLSRSRLRIISMAHEKIDRIDEILDEVHEKNHFVIYCGDGRLFDEEGIDGVKHIQFIKSVLDGRGQKACQFTASESMDKRMDLVDGFNRGEFDTLVAIRCLDEGINIPSIHGALILASNDDYREFVQRRGRILRLYEGKEFANIYDVIVLPSTGTPNWAAIELRRFYEYARLSINEKDNKKLLDSLLDEYNLVLDEICLFNDTEDEVDE